jgi:hypothetical protein
VRIELLLDHSLRASLLASRLMLGLKLHFASLTDSDDRNVLHSFYDSKIALGHGTQSPTDWYGSGTLVRRRWGWFCF